MQPALRFAALLLFFTLAAVWCSRPLVLHSLDALPYGTTPDVDSGINAQRLAIRPSDIHQVLFHQWLFFDNLRAGRSPFANPYEFGPLNERKLHWLGVWGFPMQLLFAAFARLSPILALNVVVLASFPITGLVHYALLRACKVRPWFSFLGSSLFAFALGRCVQLFCGHMNGALYYLLSLAVWLYLKAIARRSWLWASAAGASVVLWALAEWHMFYFSCLFFPVLVLAVIASQPRERWGSSLLLTSPLLAGAVLGSGYLLWYRSASIVGSIAAKRTWDDVVRGSPDPYFLVSEQAHLQRPVVFGPDVESAIAVGVQNIALLICTLALHAWLHALWTKRNALPSAPVCASPTDKLQATLLVALCCAGLVFALLSTGARGDDFVRLYSFLHAHLPHFDIVRVPGRMIYIVYFCVAVSVPVALERLFRCIERSGVIAERGARAASVIVALTWSAVPLAAAPGVLLSGVLRSADFVEVRHQVPRSEPVLLLPIYDAGSSQSSLAEHFIVATRRATINGYAPNAPLPAAKFLGELSSMNHGTLAPGVHRDLYALGVRHVVSLKNVSFLRESIVDADYLAKLEQASVLERANETAHYRMYRLRPPK